MKLTSNRNNYCSKPIHRLRTNRENFSFHSKQGFSLDKSSLKSKFTIACLVVMSLIAPIKAYAICPVCTAAAIGGVGISRWLGIDDLISGIWIGGLLASTTGWTNNWLNARKWTFPGSDIIVGLLYYGFVVIPFYFYDLVTHPRNKYIGETYIGVDKLLLGIAVGTIFFAIAVMSYQAIKKRNGGHAWFPFQKIVMPIGTLVILSIIAYFITKS